VPGKWVEPIRMLRQTSPNVIECLRAAAEAHRLYERESDPNARLAYLQLEQCWYRLADCHAFMEQLAAFL
jgi:hypothetical protein